MQGLHVRHNYNEKNVKVAMEVSDLPPCTTLSNCAVRLEVLYQHFIINTPLHAPAQLGPWSAMACFQGRCKPSTPADHQDLHVLACAGPCLYHWVWLLLCGVNDSHDSRKESDAGD
jgi:hypothetical protein